MRHRVAPERNPHQHLRLAIRSDPPKRLVLPLAQDRADAVEVIRRGVEVADARVRHRGDRAPRVAGHVADHHRINRSPGLFGELGGVAEEADQFLGAAQPGQLVQIHSAERHLAALHGVQKLRALRFIEPALVKVRRPEHLDIPDKARARRIIRRALGGGDAIYQILHLLRLDGRLDFRVANVRVRVRQDVNRERPHGFDFNLPLRQNLSAGFNRDRHARVGFDLRHEQFKRVCPLGQAHVERRPADDAQSGVARFTDLTKRNGHWMEQFS